ncbi:MAG: hypothetical protein RIS47_1418 [Bacteroidota bacterium]|jgi:antitoxin component YwqK of YwqJK toxin-antitoxin module
MRGIKFLVMLCVCGLFLVGASCKTELEQEVVASYPDGSPMKLNGIEYKGDAKVVTRETRLYPNAQVEMEGGIANGQRDGVWTYFKEDGKKWMEESYKDGVMQGPVTVWYLNGELKYEGEYTAGRPSGKWKFYDEKGTLTKEQSY